jgi:hypothetical protein
METRTILRTDRLKIIDVLAVSMAMVRLLSCVYLPVQEYRRLRSVGLRALRVWMVESGDNPA